MTLTEKHLTILEWTFPNVMIFSFIAMSNEIVEIHYQMFLHSTVNVLKKIDNML